MKWICFKYATYLLGYTFCIGRIVFHNTKILNELIWFAYQGVPNAMLYAIITFEVTAALYPIWVIGVVGITKEWKNDWQKEDPLPSSSG